MFLSFLPRVHPFSRSSHDSIAGDPRTSPTAPSTFSTLSGKSRNLARGKFLHVARGTGKIRAHRAYTLRGLRLSNYFRRSRKKYRCSRQLNFQPRTEQDPRARAMFFVRGNVERLGKLPRKRRWKARPLEAASSARSSNCWRIAGTRRRDEWQAHLAET